MESRVPYRGIGAQLAQQLYHFEVPGHSSVVQRRGPPHFIEIKLELRHQSNRISLVAFRRQLEQFRTMPSKHLHEGRILREQRPHLATVTGETGCSQRISIVQ